MFHVKHELEAKLEAYRQLVEKYHAALDLMSAKGLVRLNVKIADALVYAEAARPLVTSSGSGESSATLLDVGSGAGLPGMILAMALPDCEVYLIERRQRRGSFLRLAKSYLGVRNAHVVTEDVRTVGLSPIGVITAQSVASFTMLYQLTQHLHGQSTHFLARKGDEWTDEVRALEHALSRPVEARVVAELSARGKLIQLRV